MLPLNNHTGFLTTPQRTRALLVIVTVGQRTTAISCQYKELICCYRSSRRSFWIEFPYSSQRIYDKYSHKESREINIHTGDTDIELLSNSEAVGVVDKEKKPSQTKRQKRIATGNYHYAHWQMLYLCVSVTDVITLRNVFILICYIQSSHVRIVLKASREE